MKTKTILAFGLLFSLFSCKFDEKETLYDYSSIYLPNQDYNRNIVVGEGLALKVGVTLSGMLKNSSDRKASFAIVPELITEEGRTLLPENYYTLENTSTIVVPKGELKGYLTVKLDSTAFLADPKALTGEYILPFQLTGSSDVDRIDEEKNYIRIAISYFAKQHGNYYYHGTTRDSDGSSKHYENKATETNSFRLLETSGPKNFRMIADPTGELDPAKNRYILTLEVPTHGGGEVLVGSAPDSPVPVEPNGKSSYDETTKTFYLNYKYTGTDGKAYEAADTLIFRNRIRDVQKNGLYLNEWRGF